MSGLNTSWGVQEQNERIISALAWLIVVIMLFYASVFMYKRVMAPPADLVASNEDTVLSGTAAVKDPSASVTSSVFNVDRTGNTVSDLPNNGQSDLDTTADSNDVLSSDGENDDSDSTDGFDDSSDDSSSSGDVDSVSVSQVVASGNDGSSDSASDTNTSLDHSYDDSGSYSEESLFTIKLGDFETVAEAQAAAYDLRILKAYSYQPVANPYNRRVYLQVGKFRDPRAAQVALISVRTAAPTMAATVIPFQDSGVSHVSLIDSGSHSDDVAAAISSGSNLSGDGDLDLSDEINSSAISATVKGADGSGVIGSSDSVKPLPTRSVVPATLPTRAVMPVPLPTRAVMPVPAPTRTVMPTPAPTRTVMPTPAPTRTSVDSYADSFPPDSLPVDAYSSEGNSDVPDYSPGSDLGPRPPKGYSVQVGSFSSRKNAVTYRLALTGAGYTTYIFKTQNNGQDWYRVQLGNFGGREMAKDLLSKFEAAYNQPSIIILRR
jgi:septal ring-binding cell division protein DamX